MLGQKQVCHRRLREPGRSCADMTPRTEDVAGDFLTLLGYECSCQNPQKVTLKTTNLPEHIPKKSSKLHF